MRSDDEPRVARGSSLCRSRERHANPQFAALGVLADLVSPVPVTALPFRDNRQTSEGRPSLNYILTPRDHAPGSSNAKLEIVVGRPVALHGREITCQSRTVARRARITTDPGSETIHNTNSCNTSDESNRPKGLGGTNHQSANSTMLLRLLHSSFAAATSLSSNSRTQHAKCRISLPDGFLECRKSPTSGLQRRIHSFDATSS